MNLENLTQGSIVKLSIQDFSFYYLHDFSVNTAMYGFAFLSFEEADKAANLFEKESPNNVFDWDIEYDSNNDTIYKIEHINEYCSIGESNLEEYIEDLDLDNDDSETMKYEIVYTTNNKSIKYIDVKYDMLQEILDANIEMYWDPYDQGFQPVEYKDFDDFKEEDGDACLIYGEGLYIDSDDLKTIR